MPSFSSMGESRRRVRADIAVVLPRVVDTRIDKVQRIVGHPLSDLERSVILDSLCFQLTGTQNRVDPFSILILKHSPPPKK